MPAEMPEFAQHRDIAPYIHTQSLPAQGRQGMTICDGQGGALSLDISCGEVSWLADACRRLLSGSIPRGASAIKVHAAEKCYLLTRQVYTGSDADDAVRIVNLFDPAEQVVLVRDVAWVVISLLERSLASA